MIGRVPWYDPNTAMGNQSNGGLPDIVGALNGVAMNPFDSSGAFGVGGSAGTVPGPNSGSIQRRYIDFYASRSNSIYGVTSYVMPRHLIMRYCIKF